MLLPNAWIAIPPVSALTSLWRLTIRPPFLHANVYSIVNLAPHLSQDFGRSTSFNLYLLCIASCHLSFESERPSTSVDWMDVHAPVSVLWVVWWAAKGFIGMVRDGVCKQMCFFNNRLPSTLFLLRHLVHLAHRVSLSNESYHYQF